MSKHQRKQLSHLTDDGSLRMVDVSAKAPTVRQAAATATVTLKPSTLNALLR